MGNKDRFGLKGNTIAGTFRVDEVVAEGGFGVVYRAFHLHFRAPVALKCLKIPGELSEKERQHFLEQFRSEAEIQFRLSAALPNIVRPLHVDAVQSVDGEFVPLMALEWLEGQSFEKIIEQRTFADLPPMPLLEVMDLIGPVAQALHEAHHFNAGGESLSVVHRDIKPDNLFVTEIGGKKVVKLLDFGISKVRRTASQLAGHFSQTDGQAPFSPAYGAPEQWVPKRLGQTGPWTDVWGLALTIVEIIKGDAVIIGDHQAMMGTVLDPDVRPTPRSEGLIVSDEVESVFLKALAIDPRYRYQSIQTFWEALLAAIVLGSESISQFDETPSGRKIPLPRMSAPTPWTPPNRALFETAAPIGALPPMLAPAVLAPTDPTELAPESAYPINPASDLHPVPAAPTSWGHFFPDIPPMSADFDEVADSVHGSALPQLDPDEIQPVTTRRPTAEVDAVAQPSVSAAKKHSFIEAELLHTFDRTSREPSIKLELACTTNFPSPPSSPLWPIPEEISPDVPSNTAHIKASPGAARSEAWEKSRSQPNHEMPHVNASAPPLKRSAPSPQRSAPPFERGAPHRKRSAPTPHPEVPDLLVDGVAPVKAERKASNPPRGNIKAGRNDVPAVERRLPQPSHVQRPPPPSRAASTAAASTAAASTAAHSGAAQPQAKAAQRKPAPPPRPSARQKQENSTNDDDPDRPLSLIPARGRRSTAS